MKTPWTNSAVGPSPMSIRRCRRPGGRAVPVSLELVHVHRCASGYRPTVGIVTDRRSVCQDVVVNKRVEQGEATRAALIEVATELFAEHGYAATAIPAVLDSRCEPGRALPPLRQQGSAVRSRAGVGRGEGHGKSRTASAARHDPLDALRRGCAAYLAMCRDPMVRQISLIDAPRSWAGSAGGNRRPPCLRDGESGGRRGRGRRPSEPELVDVIAHMVLAALLEVAQLVARADEGRLATRRGQEAIDELLNALLAPTPG